MQKDKGIVNSERFINDFMKIKIEDKIYNIFFSGATVARAATSVNSFSLLRTI